MPGRRTVLTVVLFMLHLQCFSQVVTDWNDTEGIVNTWDESQILDGWDETLEEFDETDDIVLDTIPQPSDSSSIFGKRNIIIAGKTCQVPTMIVDGIDMFMLMKDGIEIYLSACPPAYYESIDEDVIRWIRFYAFSKKDYTRKIFARYEKWQDYIENTMKAHSVPPEMGLICLIESGCRSDAVSHKGAVGMWQFMPVTAQEMGLKVTSMTDERTDPIKATRVAARYLRNAYSQLDSWTLAAASYNCGIGRTAGIVRNHGKNWIETKASFPKETKQYVPALQAIHYVWTYREELGL